MGRSGCRGGYGRDIAVVVGGGCGRVRGWIWEEGRMDLGRDRRSMTETHL